MKLNIGVIKGDGIGPEVVTEAMKVLDKAGEVYGFECTYEQLLIDVFLRAFTAMIVLFLLADTSCFTIKLLKLLFSTRNLFL